MSEKDKLIILEKQIGKEKLNDILDILIKTNSEYDFDIIKIIRTEILQRFSLTEKQLIDADTNDTKRIKSIYIYFISQYTNAKSNEIAMFSKLKIRSFFRYKKIAREYINAKEGTIIYKINSGFIKQVKEIRKTIIQKIQKINSYE